MTISRILTLFRQNREQQQREREIGENVNYRRMPRNTVGSTSPMRPLNFDRPSNRAAGYVDDGRNF
jgi:hypothetical protein